MSLTHVITRPTATIGHAPTVAKKPLLMLALTLCLLAGSGSVNAILAQRQIHEIANSDYAHAASCVDFCIDVTVSRVGSAQNGQTFLMYNYSRFDPAIGTTVYEFGSGMIPNADFQAPGIKIRKHTLDTDTTNNPNIEAFTYYNDPYTGEFVVLPTNRGRITCEFERNGLYSLNGNGSFVTKWNEGTPFLVTLRQTGLSDSATARFKGSFFGIPFAAESGGFIGTYHQVSLVLERP